MAYGTATAERHEAADRSRPTVQAHLIGTRDNLLNIQRAVRLALDRLRGTLPEPDGTHNGNAAIEPDHIVFLGEQTVELSADCTRLLNQLADYI